MDRKQNVLIIHNYYKIPGGEDTVAANEKRLLEEHGHHVAFYSRSNQELDMLPFWKKLLLPLSFFFSLRTYRDVKRLIREEQIDIVHVHNTLSLISPSVYYAAFVCKVPVVQTVHNFRLLCPAATFVREGKICEDCVQKGLGCAVRHSCYRGSKIQTLVSAGILKLNRMLGTYRRLFYICLTDFNKEKLLLLNRKGKGRCVVKEERIFVKPNFVWEPETGTVQKKAQYIYIGRLDILKGIRVLLKAWKEIPDVKLLICGSGTEKEWIEQYIQENRMSQVRMMGQLPHEEVLQLLAESQGLVMPALWYEGQPMVILESYAAGTPVLASNLGNAGAMVVPGETGLRFAPGDAEDLRRVVREAWKINCWQTKEIYENLYSPEKNYEMLKLIYDYVGEQYEYSRETGS